MSRFIAEGLIHFDARYNEFSLIVRKDEGVSVLQQLYYCPWSGDTLPASQRGAWFDELEALGIDPMNDKIPDRYQGASWRSDKKTTESPP